MLFLKCPACGEILGKIQPIYELYMHKIDVLKLSKVEKEDRKAELAKMLVRDFCCRGNLLTYVDMVEIAS